MHYFAGLDLGTTHTKLVIASESLEIIFQQKLGYTRGFGATLDAVEIWQNISSLLDIANHQLNLSEHQVTIALSAAMHSLLLVDKQAEPLTPVYTWADTSSQPALKRLLAAPAANSLFIETGTPLHPMSPFCKLVWLHESNAALLAKSFKCVGIKEFVWYKITGFWEIDYSIASATGLFSQKTRNWQNDALELAGISAEKLATPVLPLHSIQVGNIQWVIGASDGCLAQIGSGAMHKGSAALTIGTSGAIRITLDKSYIDEKQELFTYLLDDYYYVCGGSTNNGGIVLDWWQEKVMLQAGETRSHVDDFLKQAVQADPGCRGLVCLPYFGGERAPVWDAGARGIFSGIHNSHGQPEFTRAILEGIGFSFKILLEKLETVNGPIHKIYASGGFSQSEWWVQLMADILQRPFLLQADEVDASAMGAIAMALKASGKISGWQEFEELMHTEPVSFIPAENLHEVYFSSYQEYKRLCLFSS